MSAAQPIEPRSPVPAVTHRKGLHLALWSVQVLLAAVFALSGVFKIATPFADLAAQTTAAAVLGEGMIRFIGISEIAGSLGLVLPALTRIRPMLTGLAAAGLVLVMVLAAGFHATQDELPAVPINTLLGLLAAFVAWGRFRLAPIAPRP